MTTTRGPGPVARAPLPGRAPRGRRAGPGSVAWRLAGPALVGASLALAAVSLLLPWALAFDPQVWVMWGEQIWNGTLDTSAGPTWKPLPVLATFALAPLGDGAVAGWLVLARAGGLLAVAGAFVLARRLDGVTAGVVVAFLLVASPWWFVNTALGNSEGILVAAVLWAGVAHLEGRRGAALALAFTAALLRPEVWPFVAAYGLASWRTEASLRPAVTAAAAGGVVLWLAPDLLGTSGAFDAVGEARTTASPGAAQHAAVPAAAVFGDAVEQLTLPGLVVAVAALVPWRGASRPVRAMALAWLGYVSLIAVSAQAGYAGNPRYLAPATALGLVVVGLGAARIARWLGGMGAAGGGDGTARSRGRERARRGSLAAVAICAAFAALHAGALADGVWAVDQRATQRASLNTAVASAGGAAALRACGTIRTAPAWRGIVAWRLGVALRDIDEPPVRPGVLLRSRPRAGAPLEPPAPAGFAVAARASRWEIRTACDGGRPAR